MSEHRKQTGSQVSDFYSYAQLQIGVWAGGWLLAEARTRLVAEPEDEVPSFRSIRMSEPRVRMRLAVELHIFDIDAPRRFPPGL
jgi:hypothetical protein